MRYEVCIYSDDYYGGIDKVPEIRLLPPEITTKKDALKYVDEMAVKMNLERMCAGSGYRSKIHYRSERGFSEGLANIQLEVREITEPGLFDDTYVEMWNQDHPDNRDKYQNQR